VRELWRSCQSKTSKQLRDAWRDFIRGWWAYYQLAEDRQSIYWLEGLAGWISRHIRKLFWLRWHNRKGRERKLRSLGVKGRLLEVAFASRGAWRVAAGRAMQSALSNAVLQAKGFLMPSDLAAKQQGC
jgi:RNA-directed DNA polymerase